MIEKASASKPSFVNIVWLIAGFVIPFAFHLITKAGIKESYYTLFIFVIACIILHCYTTYPYKNHWYKLLTGFTIFVILHFFYNLILSYQVFERWDFLCFYLFAKVGISTSDFYNPQIFQQVFNDLHLQEIGSGSFITEVVNVGFWYPPPSMLLFLPLGFFDLQTGFFIWKTIIILFLIADILLLIKFYFLPIYKKGRNIQPLLPIIILILLFPYLTTMIDLSQTISIFLFFLILLIHYIDNWKAGVFLALLVIIKPLAAIFILYFIFFRKWKIITASVITGILILIVTSLVFGINVFIDYFKNPPTDRIPDFIYFEYSSLFGVLKKLQLIFSNYLSIYIFKIIYYVISFFLIAFTFYSLRRLSRISVMKSFLIFIPLTLMIYPATLFHYILMLLPVFLNLFYQKPLNNNILKLGLLVLLYAIGYYSIFTLNLLLWLILVTWPLSLKYIENNKLAGRALS